MHRHASHPASGCRVRHRFLSFLLLTLLMCGTAVGQSAAQASEKCASRISIESTVNGRLAAVEGGVRRSPHTRHFEASVPPWFCPPKKKAVWWR
jgi:hypothetical protein